jgi:anti-sigma B factor antagonist
MDLELAQSDVRGIGVLSATGELDLATAAVLQPELWKLVDDHAGKTVLLDLRGLGSIDHVGLGVVIGGLIRAVRHGGDLCLVCGPSRVLDLLSAARLDRAFTIHPTLGEAADALR